MKTLRLGLGLFVLLGFAFSQLSQAQLTGVVDPCMSEKKDISDLLKKSGSSVGEELKLRLKDSRFSYPWCYDDVARFAALESAFISESKLNPAHQPMSQGFLAHDLLNQGLENAVLPLTEERRAQLGAAWSDPTITGAYDCAKRIIYFDVNQNPEELGTALLHQLEHFNFNEQVDSRPVKKMSPHELLVADEVYATLKSTKSIPVLASILERPEETFQSVEKVNFSPAFLTAIRPRHFNKLFTEYLGSDINSNANGSGDTSLKDKIQSLIAYHDGVRRKSIDPNVVPASCQRVKKALVAGIFAESLNSQVASIRKRSSSLTDKPNTNPESGGVRPRAAFADPESGGVRPCFRASGS